MESEPNQPYSIERVREVKQRFDDFFRSLPEGDILPTHQEVMAKASELGFKYQNPKRYAMYHLLIGSTVEGDPNITEYDFPGEDSAETFIDNLINRK